MIMEELTLSMTPRKESQGLEANPSLKPLLSHWISLIFTVSFSAHQPAASKTHIDIYVLHVVKFFNCMAILRCRCSCGSCWGRSSLLDLLVPLNNTCTGLNQSVAFESVKWEWICTTSLLFHVIIRKEASQWSYMCVIISSLSLYSSL